MQFDYEAAWDKLIQPAMEAIKNNDPGILVLMEDIGGHHADVVQDQRTLDLPWPDGLKARFEEVPTMTLAFSSFIVHNYGHWGYKGEAAAWKDATWKFSNWADQILRERLGIVKESARDRGTGYSLEVQFGLLELRYKSIRGDYHRTPVCFAVPEARDVVQGVVNLARLSTPAPGFDEVADRCMKEAAPKEGLGAQCFRLGDYMMSEERYAHVKACREAAKKGDPLPEMSRPKSNEGLTEWYVAEAARRNYPFTIDRVIHVNHRLREGVQPLKHPCNPMHPFVIGPTHLAKSNGILDPTVAPCHGCGRDYKDHVSDRVAVIRLLRNVPKSEALPLLQEFVEYVKPDGVDGFMFVETPEKFRITDPDEKPKLALAE